MPRDLKEPEGCRFSSLRNMLLFSCQIILFHFALMGNVALSRLPRTAHIRGRLETYQPAAWDMGVDGMHGVSIQSF